MTTCRLAVTAAFARGFPNYVTDPPVTAIDCPVTIYHAQPHMNRDPLGGFVIPSLFVDVTNRMDEKRRALALHESQRNLAGGYSGHRLICGDHGGPGPRGCRDERPI